MAWTFPLPLHEFAEKIRIRSVQWELKRWDELSGLGTGEVLAAELAPPRWGGVVTLATMYHEEAAQVQAMVEVLDGSLNDFFLYAPQKRFPYADPGGAIFGASLPTIHTVGGNNKSLRLEDLPAGYVLTIGDFLAFNYGSNPTRRAFHRISETVTADGSGVTPLFEVRPHLRPGVETGLDVVLVKPAAKVFIMPGTFNPGVAEELTTTGMQFEVMQRP